MKIEQIEKIYKYMEEAGWVFDKGVPYPKEDGKWGYAFEVNELDSNAAYKCVQEMERKGDWDNFSVYVTNFFELTLITDVPHFMLWSYNSTNFFTCMVNWLEEREKLNIIPLGK